MSEITAGEDRPTIAIRDRCLPLPPLPGDKGRVYYARDSEGEVFYLGRGDSWRPVRTEDRLPSAPEWLQPACALPTGCAHRWLMVAAGERQDELRCELCGVACRVPRELRRGAVVAAIAPAAPRDEESLREVKRLRKALLDVSAKAKAGAQALCFQHPRIADGFRLIQAFAERSARGPAAGPADRGIADRSAA